MPDRAIGKRFKKWRLDRNMTQQAVAIILDLKPNYICEVETKGLGLSQKSLQTLITKLDMDINWLLTGRQNNK